MTHAAGHIREAFVDWLESVERGQASFKDAIFTMWNDEQVKIPRLLNSLAGCSDQLASDNAWIVEDYRGELIRPKAWRTYANAVKVIRLLRRT